MSLEMLKSVLTTIVLALALGQALEMAQVRGYVRLLPFEKARLRQWHRWGGIAVLVLTLVVAAICVFGERYAYYSPRVQTHIVMESGHHQPIPSLPALHPGFGNSGGLADPGHFHRQRIVVLCSGSLQDDLCLLLEPLSPTAPQPSG